MILVPVVLAFVISFCGANNSNFMCHLYNETSKSLEIYCDSYQDQLPENCARGVPSFNASLQVAHLSIERCDQSIIGEASKNFQDIQSLRTAYSGYRSLNWAGSEFKRLTIFDASNNELTATPKSILSKFPQLKILYLSNNNLTRIFNDDFKNVGAHLMHLDISHNMLSIIDENAFDNLNSLAQIQLTDNQFSTFPVALSKNNVQNVIMLENRQLKTIDCTFIKAIEGLDYMLFTWEYIEIFDGGENCSKWKFTVGGSDMSGMIPHRSGYTKLACKNERIENCFANIQYFVAGPGAFENVNEMLKVLGPWALKIDLWGNPVDELNATTFQRFRNLHELNLSDTGLKVVDFSFIPQGLNRLDISENDLKKIKNPVYLMDLKSLNRFNAAGNQIENINEIIRYLPSPVQRLNLAGSPWNNISGINNLERFVVLTHLNLSDTKLPISSMNSMKSLRDLISLDVSHNNLKNANFSSLGSLDRLKEFHAAHSQIQNIAEIAQHLGPSVEKLDISGNPEAKFDPKSFNRLNNLKELDLSNSELEEIDAGQLPSTLERLDLHGNKLKEIKNLDRKHFPALKQLNILGNQLDCKQLDKTQLEFKDFDGIVGESCPREVQKDGRSNKLWIALTWIAVILVISLIVALLGLLIIPKYCKSITP